MKSIPRLRIAHLPTAIEPLPHLSTALNGPRLLIKRDDQTGLAFGGNKTRKLELLVAEAQANGARLLITAGAVQSNHCRQTAAAAARFGFGCTLILYGEKPDKVSGNLLLDQLFGANIIWTSRDRRDQVLQDAFKAAWDQGERPYLIPYGGSNATGAAGYVFAIQELAAQVSPGGIMSQLPDWIVFPSSSGGTQAGLALGAILYNIPIKILGISVDEQEHVLKERVARLASLTADFLNEPIQVKPESILVNADYLGEGYGVIGPGEEEAIRLFATLEGILLDPVYTGRAAGGLIDLIRQGHFNKDETILFWHTGGAPALFAVQYEGIGG